MKKPGKPRSTAAQKLEALKTKYYIFSNATRKLNAASASLLSEKPVQAYSHLLNAIEDFLAIQREMHDEIYPPESENS